METLVPLISGARTGPIGIAHLPRFWLKMRAHSVGLLTEGYRHGNGGSDENLITTFGIDPDAFANFIAEKAPDYLSCEAWVRANAADASPEKIRSFTHQIVSFPMPDPRLSEWSTRFGLTDGTYVLAVELNALDDWDLVHLQLRAPDAPSTKLVPAISSGTAGPLGVLHLPRLWLKHRLNAVGRLPDGYRHGVGGFDELLTGKLGVDHVAFAAYVEADAPSYLEAEAWIRKHATMLTPPAIGDLNEQIRATKMPAEMAAKRRGELGAGADGLELGIPLNDLDDWRLLHEQLKAVARV
ncbi:MAG TPA: DUF5069 domain-containing protein [Candidatus Lustribacter sp.]|nr:DUF5069 domain-containing protein [Candidatus Lustribacter sp.]